MQWDGTTKQYVAIQGMNTTLPTTNPVENLKRGAEKFPVEDTRQRQGPGGIMLDYIPIEKVLARLAEIDPAYEIEVRKTIVEKDVNYWVVFVQLDLLMHGRSISGTGSGASSDSDMAIKTAHSEAIKNAAKNGWHVGLYLWDESERELLAEERAGGSRKGAKPPPKRVKSRPVPAPTEVEGFDG